MSNITQLKDKDGNNIYPITSDKLVLDDKGVSIKDKLNNHLNNHPQGFSGNYNDLTNKPSIPSKTSELANDSGFITSADLDTSQNHVHTNMESLNLINAAKITEWNNKSNFDGNYNSLSNKPIIPIVSNDLTNELKTKYDSAHTHSTLAHAPSNAQANVQSDWNATSGDAFIKNKPTIPSIIGLATQTYVDTELGKKSNAGHTHDSSYAAKSSEHAHLNKVDIDKITAAKISSWDNKSEFSGNYNDLTGKPNIPSIVGLATESYVNTKVAGIVASAPETLDTLKELSDALGNDPNFATTIANQIGTKADTSYVATELAKKSDVHSHPYKPSSYVPSWNEVSGKPSTYTPSSHGHDEYIKYELLSGSVVVPTVTILSEE